MIAVASPGVGPRVESSPLRHWTRSGSDVGLPVRGTRRLLGVRAGSARSGTLLESEPVATRSSSCRRHTGQGRRRPATPRERPANPLA